MSGVGLRLMRLSQKFLNSNFVCHVIRDVFPIRTFTVVYDRLKDIAEAMYTPLHGIGCFQLHSELYLKDEQFYWPLGEAEIYFGQYIDLFVSVNYDPIYKKDLVVEIANQLKNSIKNKGIVFLVNPGGWADKLGEVLSSRHDLEKEIKRYSIFKNEDVRVYENI